MLVFSKSIKPVKSPSYEYLDISLSGENSHPYIVFLVEIIRTSYLKWIKRLITIESIEGGRHQYLGLQKTNVARGVGMAKHRLLSTHLDSSNRQWFRSLSNYD